MESREQQKGNWKKHVEQIKAGPKEKIDSISSHLKAFRPDAQRLQEDLNDMSPNLGGALRRRRNGREITAPLAGQPSLDLEENTQIQTQVSEGLKNQQPKDQIVQEAVEGYQDPKTIRAATRQNRAIRRSMLKRTKEKSQGIETPTEQ